MSTPVAATAVYRIPFLARPIEMQINLGGTVYILRSHWCDPAPCWLVDFLTLDGARLLSGVPLVTGADLFGQFAYLDFNGMLLVLSTDGPWDTLPTYTSLGTTSNAYYVPAPA